MKLENKGTIYLIHLRHKLGKPQADRSSHGLEPRKGDYQPHAQHYLGWTTDINRRMEEHKSGYRNGNKGASKFMIAVKAAGIPWRLVRTWKDKTVADELRIKRTHKLGNYCPICRLKRQLKQQRSTTHAR